MAMREIKFEYLEQNVEHKGISKEVYSLEEIESNAINMHYLYTSLWKLITKRQYTGLKDKNGEEIYEADLVIYHGEGDYVYEVKYIKEDCQFFAQGITKTQSENNLGYKICERLEVIGNIYENGELLEQ